MLRDELHQAWRQAGEQRMRADRNGRIAWWLALALLFRIAVDVSQAL